MGKTTPKVPFFKGSGGCPKILDYTLIWQSLAKLPSKFLQDQWPCQKTKFVLLRQFCAVCVMSTNSIR